MNKTYEDTMNNQNYQKQVIEINLKELIWDIAAQWKAVLLVAVAVALLMCGARYAKDKSAFEASIISQKEAEKQQTLTKAERISAVVDALPSDKREAVWLIVQEKEWVDAQRDYLRESILMRTDPTNQRVLALVYKINAENGDDLQALTQAYGAFAFSKETEDVLGSLIDPNADKKYIGELIQGSSEYSNDSDANEITGTSGNAFTIRIVLPEETNAENVAAAISETLAQQGKSLDAQSPHSIKMVNCEEIRIYDRKTIKDRKNTFDSINSLETMIKTERNSLSADQDAAVGTILRIIDAEESAQDTPSATVVPTPGLNIKYAVLGFILGILIYVLCYVVIIILKGNVNSASGIEGYTNSRLLGEAYYKGNRTGIAKLFHSDCIDNLRYRGIPEFESQLDRINKTVSAVCTHANVKDLTIIKVTNTEKTMLLKDALETISESIGNSGVKSKEIDALEGFEENELLKTRDAIIVIGEDTKVSHLGKVSSLCRDYDVNIHGSIYLSEM